MPLQTTTEIRPDLLQVISQRVSGGGKTIETKRYVSLTVTKGFNEPQDTISVEVHPEKENALININFSNGENWIGTFAELHTALINDRSLRSLVKHNQIPT